MIDVPFFVINQIFGYWPFGNKLSLYWASYDNTINTTTNLHMLYIIYMTLRSIKAPSTFKNEYLIKKPYILIIIFWAVGLLIWIPIVNVLGTIEYSTSVKYNSLYIQLITNIFTWLIIDILILVLSIYFLVLIRIKSINMKKYKSRKINSDSISKRITRIFSFNSSKNVQMTKRRDVYTEAQSRFLIITSFFFIQWIIPSLANILSSLSDIDNDLAGIIYWLTYTVCFTGLYF